jgi:hypothetical protein
MPTAKLTTEQLEIVGQFADYSFEYPRLEFDAVSEKVGVKFPNTPAGRLFKKEAKEVFHRERQM